MKVSKLLVPAVALTATINSNNQVLAFTPEECVEKYQQVLASCALLGPFSGPCVAAASAALVLCMAGAI